MTVMHPDRELARRIADAMGFFWLPCPLCKKEFGGHEQVKVEHESTIPKDWTTDEMGIVELHLSTSICPDCTVQGLGCKRTVEIGFGVHEDCEYLQAHLRKLRGQR